MFALFQSLKRFIISLVILTFSLTTILPSQSLAQSVAIVPNPTYTPPIIHGLTINPQDPLKFDFIIDVGDNPLEGEAFRQESLKLIKYFLVALTVPENDLWVNLSPTEPDRIIPEFLRKTDLGHDLLEEDLQLKKLAARLMGNLLKEKKEDGSAKQEVGQSQNNVRENTSSLSSSSSHFSLPSSDLLSRIWIVPDVAEVYVKGTNVFVVKSHLRVMFDEDLNVEGRLKREDRSKIQNFSNPSLGKRGLRGVESINQINQSFLFQIETAVNTAPEFAKLRQIQNSAILAAWYKKSLMASVEAYHNTPLRFYIDQKKMAGIDGQDKNTAKKIYDQYLAAFQQGVSGFINEEYDPESQSIITQKYLTGGIISTNAKILKESSDFATLSRFNNPVKTVSLVLENADGAMTADNGSQTPFWALPRNNLSLDSWMDKLTAILNINPNDVSLKALLDTLRGGMFGLRVDNVPGVESNLRPIEIKELGNQLRAKWQEFGWDKKYGGLNEHLAFILNDSLMDANAWEKTYTNLNLLMGGTDQERLNGLLALGLNLTSHIYSYGWHVEKTYQSKDITVDIEIQTRVMREYLSLLWKQKNEDWMDQPAFGEFDSQGVTQRDLFYWGLVAMLNPLRFHPLYKTYFAWDVVNYRPTKVSEFLKKDPGSRGNVKDFIFSILDSTSRSIEYTSGEGSKIQIEDSDIAELIENAFRQMSPLKRPSQLSDPLRARIQQETLVHLPGGIQEGKHKYSNLLGVNALEPRSAQVYLTPTSHRVVFPGFSDIEVWEAENQAASFGLINDYFIGRGLWKTAVIDGLPTTTFMDQQIVVNQLSPSNYYTINLGNELPFLNQNWGEEPTPISSTDLPAIQEFFRQLITKRIMLPNIWLLPNELGIHREQKPTPVYLTGHDLSWQISTADTKLFWRHYKYNLSHPAWTAFDREGRIVKGLSEIFDGAMTANASSLLDNPWMNNFFWRTASYANIQSSFTNFLKRDHPFKIEAFDEVNKMSADDILVEADKLLSTEANESNGYYGLGGSNSGQIITLRRHFLIPTIGTAQDLIQTLLYALGEINPNYFDEKSKTSDINKLKALYIVLQAINILSQKKDLFIIQKDDIGPIVNQLKLANGGNPYIALNLLSLTDVIKGLEASAKNESIKNLLEIVRQLNTVPEWQATFAKPEVKAKLEEVEQLRDQAMIGKLLETNPYLRKVLSDLGDFAPRAPLNELSFLPQDLLDEEHTIERLPFILSSKGKSFINDLFKIDITDDFNISLASIVIRNKDLSLPLSLIIEDTRHKRIYHLQILGLSIDGEASPENRETAQKVKFVQHLAKPQYRGIYRAVTKHLIDSYDEDHKVEGAMLELIPYSGKLRNFPSYSATFIHVSQPPEKAIGIDEKAYHDMEVVMHPNDQYHNDFISFLRGFANTMDSSNQHPFINKKVGVIGTGQGADVIDILQYSPRSVVANDISLIAAIVSEWNIQLAIGKNGVNDSPSVEVVHSSGVDSFTDVDVIVWNTPAIIPNDFLEIKLEGASPMKKNYLNIYGIKEKDFLAVLRGIAHMLDSPQKTAVIRIAPDKKLRETGENSVDVARRFLNEVGLTGELSDFLNSGDGDIWIVRKTSLDQGEIQTNPNNSILGEGDKTELGGIDLNANSKILKEKGEQVKFPINENKIDYKNDNPSGFIPRIISISPPQRLQMLHGKGSASRNTAYNVSSLN